MSHEQFEEAIPLYAAKTLEGPERQALEAHLRAGCAACDALLQDYQEVMAALAYQPPAKSMPPEVRERILAAYRRERRQQPAAGPGRATEPRRLALSFPGQVWRWSAHPAFVMVLLVLLAGTAFYAWSLRQEVGRHIAEHQQRTEV